MKKYFSGLAAYMSLFALLTSSLQIAHAQPKNEKDTWMLTYFRQRYPTRIEINAKGETVEVPLPDPMLIDQLHIALSSDGRHWTPLNNNKPIWEQPMRDQFIHRGPDGLWRLIATGGKASKDDRQKFGPTCIYATSKDLIHWQFDQNLHLMKDVRNKSGDLVRNIWAPEYFYDEATKEYTLIWSSSFKDTGWKESRLWYCKTTDWKTFTPAKVLFEPPYSVIDGTVIRHKETYYLFHKEEEFGVKTGERRGIRVATSKKIEGPYKIHNGPLNKGQIAPVITEGPSVMKDPVKPGWLLLYDYPMVDQYGISTSADLFHWTMEKDITMPPDARHGSVSKLTKAEAKALREAFPEIR
ncbi:MAG TPA: glycoside hydrolase family 43 protein [Pedobacter sp.]|nr:glycoside hydrolase family 43 protein [Pedobacter sp.]